MKKAAGCLVLKLHDSDTGASVFDLFWDRIVDAAVADPSLYRADLARIKTYQEDYSIRLGF